MKLYHGDKRHDAYPQNILIDVKFERKSLACISKSKVDKTFFKPGLSDLAQIDKSLSSRVPIYDQLPDGSMPDVGVNLAWLRSKARDRVDVDLALEVVKETINRSKLEDEAKAKEAEKAEKQLSKLAETIKAANSEKIASEDSSVTE